MSNTLDTSFLNLARAIASTQDVDKLLSQISEAVERFTGSEAASILLLDDEKKQLVFRVATGNKGSSVKKFYVPVGKGVAGWVAEKGEAVIVNDVHNDERFTGQIDKNSGFSTKSILAIPMFANGELIGVCEALNKIKGDYSEADQKVLEQLSAYAAAVLLNARAAEDYKNFFSHVIEILVMAIEGSDSKMTGHSYRVAEMACRIGRELGIEGDDYRNLYYGAILHDLGMLALHDLRLLPNILKKTIERTPDKLHPLVGAELVKDIRLLSTVAPIIQHHHEYVDGSGHPDGLVGDDIPLASRIICVAEAVEDIRMEGLLGEAFDAQVAKTLTEGDGSKFDHAVVEAYLTLYSGSV